jgi:tetratricopeptide (TPR) repeat protein
MNAHSAAIERLLARGLNEASGYMELGLPTDADDALAALPDPLQSHPVVMGARVEALLAAAQWEEARRIAARLTDCMEEYVDHWIWWAYATRRAESVEAAEEILERALDEHPDASVIHYNLACYAAVQGRLEEARQKLGRAVELDPELSEMAAEDPDLEALRTAGEADT